MTAASFIQRHTPTARLASLTFISMAALGMVAPYINLYLVESNLSPTLIGTLSSVGAVLTLSLTPWFNHIADKYRLHRRLLIIYFVLAGLANIMFATSNLQWVLIGAFLISRIAVSPSITLTMQLTMTQIAEGSKKILGQIRSFAAFGFAAASFLAGAIFDLGGYTVLFGTGAFFALISIFLSTIFPARSNVVSSKPARIRDKRHVAFYVLVASQFFVMMGIRNSFTFLFIHFTENLGISTGNIGFWGAFLAGVEIPIFIFSDRFLPRIKSKTGYLIGILAMAAAVFLLGAVQNTTLLILVIVFRGFAWPVLFLSGFTIVSDFSEKQNVATNQAIVQVTMPAIALLLTGTAFGWVYDHYEPVLFFGLCASMCLVGAMIMVVFRGRFDKALEVQTV
ncbi:MAG: MFS family permease [Cellvibrionaceae bacterium]|jgi:MFS family permease